MVVLFEGSMSAEGVGQCVLPPLMRFAVDFFGALSFGAPTEVGPSCLLRTAETPACKKSALLFTERAGDVHAATLAQLLRCDDGQPPVALQHFPRHDHVESLGPLGQPLSSIHQQRLQDLEEVGGHDDAPASPSWFPTVPDDPAPRPGAHPEPPAHADGLRVYMRFSIDLPGATPRDALFRYSAVLPLDPDQRAAVGTDADVAYAAAWCPDLLLPALRTHVRSAALGYFLLEGGEGLGVRLTFVGLKELNVPRVLTEKAFDPRLLTCTFKRLFTIARALQAKLLPEELADVSSKAVLAKVRAVDASLRASIDTAAAADLATCCTMQ